MEQTSAPPLTGLLLIDKPPGPTSMDVVRRVRHAAGHRGRKHWVKCGHAGTLDPLASGLLIVLLGKATKLVPRLMDMGKTYETIIDLSAFTTTDDREGEREWVGERVGEVGEGVFHVEHAPAEEAVRAACAALTGTIQQRPPAYSAVHVDGERAYKMARRGDAPDLPPRPVRVDRFDVLAYRWPLVTARVECGKGTYIRSLARDLGVSLGTGGHLADLRRTRIGMFHVEHATPLDDLPQTLRAQDLRHPAIDPDAEAHGRDG